MRESIGSENLFSRLLSIRLCMALPAPWQAMAVDLNLKLSHVRSGP